MVEGVIVAAINARGEAKSRRIVKEATQARLLDLGWIWTATIYMRRLNFRSLYSICQSLAGLDLGRRMAACGVMCCVGNESLVVGECMSSFLLCALWTHLRSVGALVAVKASNDESSDARLHFGGAFVLLTAAGCWCLATLAVHRRAGLL